MEMFHVNGGTGEASYADNSLLQRKVMSLAWPVAREAIRDLCQENFPTKTFTMADLGCSSGPNALLTAFNLLKEVEQIREGLGKEHLEYQILLNDLHGNDFNAIFTSLPSFLQSLIAQLGSHFGPCFFNGVPGSFYNRLFPAKSVHFFHSSNALQWLSQVPEGIENIKGNIFMTCTTPKSVVEAYYRQFQKDFSMFLKRRAEELASGGRMVLTMLGRTSEDPWSKECTSFWEFLSLALNSMVSEGFVEEEKADSFNIPNYMPSLKEVEVELLKEGSFSMNHFEVSRIGWNFCVDSESNSSNISSSIDSTAYNFAYCVRSVVESLLKSHFGEAIVEELFRRYENIIADKLSKEKLELINFTICLVKTK